MGVGAANTTGFYEPSLVKRDFGFGTRVVVSVFYSELPLENLWVPAFAGLFNCTMAMPILASELFAQANGRAFSP
jgi:hypothetical protein